MRQHPRPTYGKARGQWPPQLDKGDSSAQFHGQMESARCLSLTVEFSAPLRCVWQRVSLAREIFFMQGMKNGTECTLSHENETLPGAKPDSERNRYDPCTTERCRRPRRPPKRAGREKGGAKKHRPPVQEVSVVHLHGGTRFPHTESAPAATLSYTMQFSWLAPRGTDIPPRLQPTFSWASPQWRTFVPAALAASVHPCAHSTGRAGFGHPFPSMPTPGPWWAVRPPATLDQQTVCLLVSDIILQELAVVNPPPYPNATSRIIITVKPAAKASAPGPESPRVGSSSAATT